MKTKLYLAALFAVCLLVTGIAVADEAPDCTGTLVLDVQSEDGTLVKTEDGQETTLEQILSTSPEDPQTKAIDSGICCYSKSDCPSVSGYYHFCGSGSCSGKGTCLYRR